MHHVVGIALYQILAPRLFHSRAVGRCRPAAKLVSRQHGAFGHTCVESQIKLHYLFGAVGAPVVDQNILHRPVEDLGREAFESALYGAFGVVIGHNDAYEYPAIAGSFQRQVVGS